MALFPLQPQDTQLRNSGKGSAVLFYRFFLPPWNTMRWRPEQESFALLPWSSSNLSPFVSHHKSQLSQALVKEQTSSVWLLLAMQLNPDAVTKIQAPQGWTLSLWEYASGIYKTQWHSVAKYQNQEKNPGILSPCFMPSILWHLSLG